MDCCQKALTSSVMRDNVWPQLLNSLEETIKGNIQNSMAVYLPTISMYTTAGVDFSTTSAMKLYLYLGLSGLYGEAQYAVGRKLLCMEYLSPESLLSDRSLSSLLWLWYTRLAPATPSPSATELSRVGRFEPWSPSLFELWFVSELMTFLLSLVWFPTEGVPEQCLTTFTEIELDWPLCSRTSLVIVRSKLRFAWITCLVAMLHQFRQITEWTVRIRYQNVPKYNSSCTLCHHKEAALKRKTNTGSASYYLATDK